MRKVFSIIFFILSIASYDTKSFSDIEVKIIKKQNIEVIKFQMPDQKFPGKDDVLAQIHFPSNIKERLPIIIHQHGSTRDGYKFKKWGGKTDEWGKRLIDKATERGYAVVLLDTFYKRNVEPTDKDKFPNAILAALELSYILSQDKRFDKSKIFYTGFSYGAGQVLKLQDERSAYNNIFRAAVAAEPSCNIVSKPYKTKTATLMIKGEESHYYPVACKYYFNMIKEMGNEIEYVSIPKANHFFSLNGSITKGKAVNGCSDNIVIRLPKRKLRFADGTPTNREEVKKNALQQRLEKERLEKGLMKQLILHLIL